MVKQRDKAAEGQNARAVLKLCKVPLGVDFYTLRISQVDALLTQADIHRYRKPRNANASRGRYFHSLMQSRAKW